MVSNVVTVRPDRRKFLRSTLRPLPLLVLVFMLVMIGIFASEYSRSPGALATAALAYGLFIAAAAWQVRFLRNSTITAGSGRLAWTSSSGAAHELLRDQLSGVIDRTVISGRSVRRRIMVLGSDGRVVLELSPRAWDEDQLSAAWAALGMAPDVDRGLITAADLRRQYPNTTPWWVAHGEIVAALVVLGLLALSFLLSLFGGQGFL